ncbi:MAG: hypothetical protein ABI273_16795 [Lacunisphaera sp.]
MKRAEPEYSEGVLVAWSKRDLASGKLFSVIASSPKADVAIPSHDDRGVLRSSSRRDGRSEAATRI